MSLCRNLVPLFTAAALSLGVATSAGASESEAPAKSQPKSSSKTKKAPPKKAPAKKKAAPSKTTKSKASASKSTSSKSGATKKKKTTSKSGKKSSSKKGGKAPVGVRAQATPVPHDPTANPFAKPVAPKPAPKPAAKPVALTPEQAAKQKKQFEVDCLLDPTRPGCEGVRAKQAAAAGPAKAATPAGPALPKKLSVSQVRAGFVAVKPSLDQCKAKHSPAAGTTLKFKASISGAGNIIEAVPAAKVEPANAALARCVSAALRTATFPRFSSKQMGVVRTVRF